MIRISYPSVDEVEEMSFAEVEALIHRLIPGSKNIRNGIRKDEPYGSKWKATLKHMIETRLKMQEEDAQVPRSDQVDMLSEDNLRALIYRFWPGADPRFATTLEVEHWRGAVKTLLRQCEWKASWKTSEDWT